ncbi:MAG TPA: hypothetical protein VJ201_03475 [Candidatus Babeliales bacterium]|nr:hypothetical protein [Candidatus Babeliales bacterium]
MLINEIFDTKALIHWSQKDDVAVGEFELNQKLYRILLEEGEWELPSGNIKTFLNIAFVRVLGKDNEIERTALTYDSPDAAKVLGAVFNGIEEKVNHISKYDAVTFGARADEHERMRLYNKIVPLYLKDFGSVIKNVLTPSGGLVTILFKDSKESGMQEFLDFLKKKSKIT